MHFLLGRTLLGTAVISNHVCFINVHSGGLHTRLCHIFLVITCIVIVLSNVN